MNTAEALPRRHFLTSSVGLLSLATLATRARLANAADAPATPNVAAIEKVLGELEPRGGPYLSVPRTDGVLLNLLVKATRAKTLLEIGTSHGYSSIWLGWALEETGGHLTTLEIDPERNRLARENVKAAGLAHRVDCRLGDAHRIVTELAGPFDLVFLDADKEGQVDYFKKLFPAKLPPGSLLLAHNAIRQARNMKDYLDLVKSHPQFDTTVLSTTMQDGFVLSYRRRVTG